MANNNPKHENNRTLERFCPSCGAPTDPSSPSCKFCGCLLPGIAKALSEEKEKSEKIGLKRDFVGKTFDYLDKRLSAKQEQFLIAEQNRKEWEERRKKEQNRSILLAFIIIIVIPLIAIIFVTLR